MFWTVFQRSTVDLSTSNRDFVSPWLLARNKMHKELSIVSKGRGLTAQPLPHLALRTTLNNNNNNNDVIRRLMSLQSLCFWLSPLFWHQPSRCTTLQTFYGRQPNFPGCCRQDLERTAGQSRLHDVITVLSASPEDISVPEIFLVALQWT